MLLNSEGIISGVVQGQSWVWYYSVFDLDNTEESMLIKFAADTKLEGVASTLQDRIRIQNNLENWSEISKMRLNKDQCQVVH